MINLIALYRGQTLQDVKTVTVVTDPLIIKTFCKLVLDSSVTDANRDPSIAAVVDGQRKALKTIMEE